MLKNFQKLFSANIVSGVIGLITLTIVSRALGPSAYGVVAVIISFGALVEQIASFQAWQAVTKYTAKAITEKDTKQLWHIVSLGVALDIVGSLVAALFGVAAIMLFADVLGIGSEARTIAVVYMLSLVFNVSGTAMAVLRIFDHYNAIGILLLAMAVLKLAAIAVVWNIELSIGSVIVIFAAVNIIQSLVSLGLMLRLCRDQGARIDLTALRFADFTKLPGLVRFVTSTNLSSTVRQLVHEFDVVLLSAVAGPAVAGQYKLAKQYGSVVLRVVEPAQQVVFPKIAELIAADNFTALLALLRKLFIAGASFATAAILGYLAVGEIIVGALLGTEYDLVPSFLLVFMLAIATFSGLFFLRPLVLSFGRADAILYIYLVATALFFAVFFGLFDRLGGIAMMYAQLAFYLCWAAGMIAVVMHAWNVRTRAGASDATENPTP